MKAIIEQEDEFGEKSTFEIVGTNKNDIDNQVLELKNYARHNEDYTKYKVLEYGK